MDDGDGLGKDEAPCAGGFRRLRVTFPSFRPGRSSRAAAVLVPLLRWRFLRRRRAMKNAILVLLLWGATSAVCQSAAPSPFELRLTPPVSTQPWVWLHKPPSSGQIALSGQITLLVPRSTFVLPKLTPERRWDGAQIDPKIIVHPSPSKLGALPPGALVARNEFSGLRLLPIGSPSPRPKAVPTQWPDFNLQAIPAQWPKFNLLPVNSLPVQGGPLAPSQPSAK
jgi:hypothetical protein